MIPNEILVNWLLQLCQDRGIQSPSLTEDSNGDPVIVDTEDGKLYRLKLVRYAAG